MIRRPPRSTLDRSSAASDVYKRQGYGFIVRGAGEEIFFHKSATVGEVEGYEEGQWVLYDVETRQKGPEATDVEPYTGEPIE